MVILASSLTMATTDKGLYADQNGFTPCTDQAEINAFINNIVSFLEGHPYVYAYAYSNGEGLGSAWPLTNGQSLRSAWFVEVYLCCLIHPTVLLERRISPPSASTIDVAVSQDDASSCFRRKPRGKIVDVLLHVPLNSGHFIIHPLGLPYVSNFPS